MTTLLSAFFEDSSDKVSRLKIKDNVMSGIFCKNVYICITINYPKYYEKKNVPLIYVVGGVVAVRKLQTDASARVF